MKTCAKKITASNLSWDVSVLMPEVLEFVYATWHTPDMYLVIRSEGIAGFGLDFFR